MPGYDTLAYPFVTSWLRGFYSLSGALRLNWKLLYYLLPVCVVYLILQGASTVVIGIFLGLMTLPIWAAVTPGVVD